MLKKIIIHTKRGIKCIVLFSIAIFLILSAIAFLYKPTYCVLIKGEEVGYTTDRTTLQQKINNYIENGEENKENVAFVQVENLPEYRLCLLKKDVTTNDNEIFNKIKEQGITYYRYYAIAEDQEEKAYVSTFEEAETIIKTLKEKNSKNMDNISIIEKYQADAKDLISSEEAISKLYVEKEQVTKVAKEQNTINMEEINETIGTVNTALTTSKSKAKIGLALIKPVSGTITARFGAGSNIRKSSHTGLDIATSTGTPVLAAASGVVTFSGNKGSYGKMIVISHGNGVQTYYGHCSKLYVPAGTRVTQGQTIAAVGSTGNSTGPHLHLEVRVNGVAYNPQNYVY